MAERLDPAMAELRRIAVVRGATAAIEARDILAQMAQSTLDSLDVRARSLLAEGKLTGEAAIAMWAERSAILRLFASLEGDISRGQKAVASGMRPPGA